MMSAAEFHECLNRELAGLLSVGGEVALALYRHYELLLRWNQRMNLTAIRDPVEIVRRHYCESLFLGLHLPASRLSLADVGSGAGFPGIPLAVFRPDCDCTLIESRLRKAVFLREATRSLPNVCVFEGRAEDCGRRFGWLVSRGVAPSEAVKLVPVLAPAIALLVGTGDWVAVKGVAGVVWHSPVKLPWGNRRVLLLGEQREQGEQREEDQERST